MLDKDEVSIFWVLPDCSSEYKSGPLNYLSHLFGHEGENSILSYLKKEGYALTLGAGPSHNLNIFSDFTVTIKLTEKGLAHYKEVV